MLNCLLCLALSLQDSSGVAEHALSLLQRTLPSVVRDVDLATSSGCSQARKAMIQLHLSDKKIEYTDSLMVRERVLLATSKGLVSHIKESC